MKRVFILAIFFLVVPGRPTAAQDEPKLASLEISLWPEFDRPEMLVIYRGLLSSETGLPAPVELRIPARVREPSAVAYVDSAGQRLNQEYSTREEGQSLVVSFELATAGFQVEYYDPLSTDSAGQRGYVFDYVADYAVALLNLEFQVPPTAEGFALDPEADVVTQEGDGLTYHLATVREVERGQAQNWSIAYRKTDSALTYDALFPAQSPTEPVASESSESSIALMILGGFVALVATGAGGFWLGRRTQAPMPAATPQRPRRRGSGRGVQVDGREPSQRGPQPGAYCHRCGAPLRLEADFCYRCGTKVRLD